MSLTVTRKLMWPTDTAHVARIVDGSWEVSWLPGRVLSEDAGVAMIIAESADGCLWAAADPRWPALGALATELGLSAAAAVMMVVSADPAAQLVGRHQPRVTRLISGRSDAGDGS
jgi:hypothetical protein